VTWVPFALFALVRWSTARFYRWNAIVSLAVYLPFALLVPPRSEAVAGALGLSLLMALTFWVTTEATRRGPVSVVAPLTATSPALTVLLAVVLLSERPDAPAVAGVVLAIAAALLLALRPGPAPLGGWLALAVSSLVLQGVGAFIAKVVVTEGGPTTLLLTSVVVQLAVGAYIARAEPLDARSHLRGIPLVVTVTLAAAALATIGYLFALSVGPASIVVPLVATSPALGGLLGALVLRERLGARRAVGVAIGLAAIALLAGPS
jgi:uncharacterized membrane protein